MSKNNHNITVRSLWNGEQ